MSLFCNILSHTFRNYATIHGRPTDRFSFDVEKECQNHLLTDERATALQHRAIEPLIPGKKDTLHAYLCGENAQPFQGNRHNLVLFDPNNRVIRYRTGDFSLVIKGQDTKDRKKGVCDHSVGVIPRSYDHFARLKMGDWMRKIREDEDLDRIEIARDYAIKAPSDNLPLKEKYYIGSDFIPDLLAPGDALKALNALPSDEKRELIRQMTVMIQRSGYLDVHLGNILFKKNNAGQLIGLFVDLEPFGLFRTKADLRKIGIKNSKSRMIPDSLEEYSRLGLHMFLRIFRKQLVSQETRELAEEIIGGALQETQAAIKSCQTTPLSSINPHMCFPTVCCAPCLCINACKVWKETHPFPNKGKPPEQFMELIPTPRT
ncbi:MAG TPA: hypothetical protein VLE89_03545 [Chlamydiales bacterium]|nr:hypothetical protein [Chlamydiales bacterium]